MRKVLKILHTAGSCGFLGALLAYAVVLLHAPQDTPLAYANARETIAALSTYLLVPSMALTVVSGVLAIAVHRPFQSLRWVWLKAALGISLFEATLGLAQSKANSAASLALQIARGEDQRAALAETIAYEWRALSVLMVIALVNIVVGVWRPVLRRSAVPAA